MPNEAQTKHDKTKLRVKLTFAKRGNSPVRGCDYSSKAGAESIGSLVVRISRLGSVA